MKFSCYVMRLLVLTALAFTLLSGEARAESGDQSAILTLILNQARRREVIVVLRGSDVWVSADDLDSAGLGALRGRSQTLLGRRHISLSSLSPPLHFTFDEKALTLDVTAPPGLLPETVIDLRKGAPAALKRSTDLSAFLNYNATLADFTVPSGFAEAGVSVDGALFTSTVSANLYSGVVRGLSSLIVDERKDLQRWTVGDSFVTSGPLGSGMFVGGVSVTKSFDIDPYLIHQPSLGYTDNALTPSTLRVYVNGALVRTENVAPGPFHVQNIPALVGSGDVRYVLRDALGNERSVTSPYSMAQSQLARGQMDYTYALGFRRTDVATQSFAYGAPGALIHHRVGVTDSVTLGGRLEASFGVVSGGSTVSVIVPLGFVSASIAASGGEGGLGFAAAAAYGYTTRRFGVAASIEASSDHYATLSLDPADDRSSITASVLSSVSTFDRVSFSAQTALSLPRDAPWRLRASASARVGLTKRLGLVCELGRTLMGDLTAPFDVSAVLTYSFERGFTASGGARLDKEGPAMFAEVSRPIPGQTGFGGRAQATASEHPAATATAQYNGDHGRYLATASVNQGGPHLTLEANGAFVALDKAGVFATPPIHGGFAVIRVPGVKNVKGYRDNHEVGSTDSSGNLVVPDLLPYYANKLRISDQDLPLDFSLNVTEILLAPPLRGGALAEFSAERVTFYRGRARIRQGDKETIPLYGQLSIAAGGGAVESPIGNDGAFELAGLPSGQHTATITYKDGKCAATIKIPASDDLITDIGTFYCAK